MKYILCSLLFAVALPLWSDDRVVLVAHPSVGTPELSKAAWSAIFLKKTALWPDGSPVVPIDQKETGAVRIAFTSLIHGKTIAAVRSYWHQQIFSGRQIPPKEMDSDAAVAAHVKATPGAVGYVSAQFATPGLTRIDVR